MFILVHYWLFMYLEEAPFLFELIYKVQVIKLIDYA